MPIIKSAVKRVKQAGRRRDLNISVKTNLKLAVKAFMQKPSAETLSAAHGAIDTAVKKNVLKKNTAARRKSRLSRIAKEAKVTLTATKKPTAKKPATTKAAPAKKAAPKKETAAKKPTAKKPAAKEADKKTK